VSLDISKGVVDRLEGRPRRDWNGRFLTVLRRDAAEQAEEHRRWLARRQQGTSPSLPLSAYVGPYEHPAYGRCEMVAERDRLRWRWRRVDEPLEHYHFDTFRHLRPVAAARRRAGPAALPPRRRRRRRGLRAGRPLDAGVYARPAPGEGVGPMPDVRLPERPPGWRWWVCGLLLLATTVNYI